MSGRPSTFADGSDINTLPTELLSFPIKDLPRATLTNIASLLSRNDSLTSGNWEALAEHLGVGQSSYLDHLTQEARVRKYCPGLLMLQQWATRPGSTAVVLLHALRDIHREDALKMVVDKLFDLHTMQLSVSVQDRNGILQFLRVRTRKSAPLHASLENLLENAIFWYDIKGPRHDLDWSTPSGELQGTQLMLQLRSEPDEESVAQIYGSVAMAERLHNPPPSANGSTQVVMSSGQNAGLTMSQLQLNIPLPSQNNISVTIPIAPGHSAQLNVQAKGPGVRLVNKPPVPMPPRPAPNLSDYSRRPPPSSANFSPPPPACGPACSEGYSPPYCLGELSGQSKALSPESALSRVQPMTNLPLLSDFDTTIDSGESQSLELSGSVTEVTPQKDCSARPRPRQAAESAMEDWSHTVIKEPYSHAGLDTIRPLCPPPHCPSLPVEHDESDRRSPDPRAFNAELVAAPGGCGQSKYNLMVPDKQTLDRNVKMGFVESKVHNFLHSSADPPSHLAGSGICSGPGRHTGLGKVSTGMVSSMACSPLANKSLPSTTTLHLDYIPHDSAILFCNTRQPVATGQVEAVRHSPTHCSSAQLVLPKATQSPKEAEQLGYVPHAFIVQQSRRMPRSASAPLLEGEDMQTESEEEREEVGMETAESTMPKSWSFSKPHPCGYSSYRPDLVDHENGSMEVGGFSLQHQFQQQQQQQHQPLPLDVRNLSPNGNSGMSLESYVSAAELGGDSGCVVGFFNLQDVNDGSKRSSPEDALSPNTFPHHLWNRQPYLQSPPPDPLHHVPSSSVRQPRSRCPLTEADALLLEAPPEPHYTYVDAQSLGAPASGPPAPRQDCVGRRRSGGNRQLPDSELQQVPGWNPLVNEKSVEEEMARCINDDGNFIVWRYLVGGKYVISVSHLRRLRHYAVYETEREGAVWYYIFPKGPRLPTLRELVLHCQRHGVAEHTKTFRTPEGGTHRGSGMCLHVRLKNAVPVRTRAGSN